MADNPKIEDSTLSQTEASNRSVFADQLIGFLFDGRYQIVELIGTGGWGRVYKAKHATLGIDLALKIVHQHRLQDEQSLKRFEQEALLLSRVENPYFVRIIDQGLSPAPFIVMEYVPGITLSKWLKTNGPMPQDMAIELFLQLCDALAAAEAIRIIHRDLKPENILLKSVSEGVHCKIMDFGLAKSVDMETTSEGLTATGEIVGSPAYMSPERWKGQCDHRSDIYSLGCIMYEVLTGKPPFSAQFGMEYMSKHLSDKPAPISQINVLVKFPQGLLDIVDKCMQKAPENRYQSSQACRDDLIKLKAGSKPAISLLEKIKRHKRRNLIVASSILVCGLGAYIWDQSRIAEYEDTGVRGKYYDKKAYSGSALPGFENSKDKLPSPIMDDDPHYVELYWDAWKLAFRHLRTPPPGSPLVSNFIEPAYEMSLIQWDMEFMMMFGRYGHRAFPFIESLDNFYARQYENGYICKELQDSDGADIASKGRLHSVNPPLFAWAETEYARISGDQSRFAKVLPVLAKHADWLYKYRRKSGTAHGLYWNTPSGSGMDYSPRSGSGWVDMSSQIVLMYKSMAEMADRLSLKDKSREYRAHAADIAKAINRFMWNDSDGLYYDVDDKGKQIPCKTVACFWPMLAGVSDERQIPKMMANLKDATTFWRHDVFPSLAANHASYKADGVCWQGGVWAPANVMIIKGLDRYSSVKGERELAIEAVRRYLDNMYAVYKKTGTIWQSYSAETEDYADLAKT